MGFHKHETHETHEHRSGSARGRRGPGGRGPGGRGPGGPGRGRQRARRGAVAEGVLLMLSEESGLHGYELIALLDEQSDGRWRPSPGSMYPALARLEERELIVGTDDDEGKRRYELTESGRARVANRDPDAPLPWDAEMSGSGGSLRAVVAEIIGQTRQIGRFGTPSQREAAVVVLQQTKADLYGVLAEGATPPPSSES